MNIIYSSFSSVLLSSLFIFIIIIILLFFLFRSKTYQDFKDFKYRILVATDLFGRGIDIEKVNIVFNYDMPDKTDTYLHRVGRAGRFGTKGLAITFVSTAEDMEILQQVQNRFEVKITDLPETIAIDSYMNA